MPWGTGVLEQRRHGRVPGFLVDVTAGRQRHGACAATDAADDRAEYVEEFRATGSSLLAPALERLDLPQRGATRRSKETGTE